MLKEKKERKKESARKSFRPCDNQMSSFVSNVLQYFRQLICNARSFASQVNGAQLLFKVFGDKLNDIEYQRWLADKL